MPIFFFESVQSSFFSPFSFAFTSSSTDRILIQVDPDPDPDRTQSNRMASNRMASNRIGEHHSNQFHTIFFLMYTMHSIPSHLNFTHQAPPLYPYPQISNPAANISYHTYFNSKEMPTEIIRYITQRHATPHYAISINESNKSNP